MSVSLALWWPQEPVLSFCFRSTVNSIQVTYFKTSGLPVWASFPAVAGTETWLSIPSATRPYFIHTDRHSTAYFWLKHAKEILFQEVNSARSLHSLFMVRSIYGSAQCLHLKRFIQLDLGEAYRMKEATNCICLLAMGYNGLHWLSQRLEIFTC